MKYVLAVLILALAGCTNQKRMDQLEAENTKLHSQVEIIADQSQQKDAYIEEYTKTVNEVYDYLERIRKREGLLMRYSQKLERDESVSFRDKIFTNLESIDQYLENSRAEISRLKKSMSQSQFKFASLDKTIDNLTALVDQKDKEITTLREEIEILNEHISETELRLAEKSEQVEKQTHKLNKAYYIIGDDEELKEKKVITKRGGIFGLGRTTTLSGSIDESYFTETDITETDSIAISSEPGSVQIISSHHPDSYHVVKENDDRTILEIIDPEEFWKMKYLVIQAKH